MRNRAPERSRRRGTKRAARRSKTKAPRAAKSGLPQSERDRFAYLWSGAVFFSVLHAGVHFDVFTWLEEHPHRTFDEVRTYLDIPEHSAKVLMLGLCGLGLLRRDKKGRYDDTPLSLEYLSQKRPRNFVPKVRTMHRLFLKSMYHLVDSLKAGTNKGLDEALSGEGKGLYDRLQQHPDVNQIVYEDLRMDAEYMNPPLAEIPELRRVRHLLDGGGGEGANALFLTSCYPQMEVTIVDYPAACAIAEKHIAERGMSQRIHTHPGDFFVAEFPAGIDGILFRRVLLFFSPDRLRTLFRKCWDALPVGGKVFVYGGMAKDDLTGGIRALRLSTIILNVTTGEGKMHSARDFETWMKDAGFSKVKRYAGFPDEHVVVIGIK